MAQTNLERARASINKHIIASVAIGIQPIPAADIVLLTGIHMNLLRRLAKIYEVEFRPEISRSLVSSFLGAAAPVGAASLIKMIPVVGTIVGAFSQLGLAGASTYALGNVFVQHFESGGTFLTLDPEKVMDHYKEELANYSPEEPPEEKNDFYGVEP